MAFNLNYRSTYRSSTKLPVSVWSTWHCNQFLLMTTVKEFYYFVFPQDPVVSVRVYMHCWINVVRRKDNDFLPIGFISHWLISTVSVSKLWDFLCIFTSSLANFTHLPFCQLWARLVQIRSETRSPWNSRRSWDTWWFEFDEVTKTEYQLYYDY